MFKKSFYFTLVLFLVSLNGLYARGGSRSVLYSSDEKMADARFGLNLLSVWFLYIQ